MRYDNAPFFAVPYRPFNDWFQSNVLSSNLFLMSRFQLAYGLLGLCPFLFCEDQHNFIRHLLIGH